MSKHEKFIMTPITSIIEEMITATSCIGKGIETYPLWDYILQATFTKMTGFQEQKLKCIDWELATNGFEYRIRYLESIQEKGTYSTFKAKNKVYNALVDEILRLSGRDKTEYITELKNSRKIQPRQTVQSLLEGTNIIYSHQRNYSDFIKCDAEFKEQFFVLPQQKDANVPLFQSSLQSRYEELYKHRNRVAHNTLSYQQNLPDLEMLKGENNLSRNYFFWFSVLFLIDEIFIELYQDYMKYLMCNSYFED